MKKEITTAAADAAMKETAAQPAKKETAKKTAAKKDTATEKKAVAEKKTEEKPQEAPAVKKTAAKKTDTKKTTAKKKAAEEKKTTLVLQYYGREYTDAEIIEKVKEAYVAESGKKLATIKELNVYVKPEENAAYYVVNGKVAGRIEL